MAPKSLTALGTCLWRSVAVKMSLIFRWGQNVQIAKFQKPKISRDVQNMMPKIITYRSRPKNIYINRVPVICNEILDGKKIRSRKWSMMSRTKSESSAKKKYWSRDLSQDCERTLTSDIGDSVFYARENSSSVVGRWSPSHSPSFYLDPQWRRETYDSDIIIMIQDVVKSSWADHSLKKNRVNRVLKVQNVPHQRNINSTRLRVDKKHWG